MANLKVDGKTIEINSAEINMEELDERFERVDNEIMSVRSSIDNNNMMMQGVIDSQGEQIQSLENKINELTEKVGKLEVK